LIKLFLSILFLSISSLSLASTIDITHNSDTILKQSKYFIASSESDFSEIREYGKFVETQKSHINLGFSGHYIIMPEFVKRADYDADNNLSSTYYYDLVFQDINSTNGAIIKTIHHKDLDGLRESVNDVNVHASVSDAHSVYFFATRTTDDTKNNLIIKIDTQSNKIQKSRNRFDNHLTGVLMDSN